MGLVDAWYWTQSDKDTLKLTNEKMKISAIPSHDNDNLATLSTFVKDPTFVTHLSPPLT